MKPLLAAAPLAALLALSLPAAAAPAAAPSAALPAGAVATVNGVAITRAALVDRLLGDTTAGQDLLSEMVNESIVEQQAKAQKLTVTQAEVDARIKMIKEATPGEQFAAYLRSQGLTAKGLPGKVRIKLLVEKLLASQAAVTEADAKAYYEQNKDRMFNVPETVQLSVIQVDSEANAQAAAARLAKGEDFGAIAKEVCTDPQLKATGGRIPRPLAKQALPPALAEIAFGTEVGKVSSPVQAPGPDGKALWYLVKVDSRAAAITTPFEKVKEQITSQLHTQKLGAAWEKWIAEQRKKADVKTGL